MPSEEAPVFFATSGIQVDPWIPPLVALAISFFTSMGGVSGAFLLLPFQVSVLGYTAPSVSATNHLFNVVAIPSGVYRYWREGRMVWPLTALVVAGTLPGVFAGAWVRIRWLPDPKNFKLFAAGVLAYIGGRMVVDLVRGRGGAGGGGGGGRGGPWEGEGKTARPKPSYGAGGASTRIASFDRRRLVYVFQGSTYGVSVPAVFLLSLVVGMVGGIYGIGGGAIMAPFFVSVFGLPVHTVAGAALMGTFVTSLAGVAFYEVLAVFHPEQSVAPDWWLGLLFGLGGMVGMYLGARTQKHVPARAIKALLAGVLAFTAARYVLEFFGA